MILSGVLVQELNEIGLGEDHLASETVCQKLELEAKVLYKTIDEYQQWLTKLFQFMMFSQLTDKKPSKAFLES